MRKKNKYPLIFDEWIKLKSTKIKFRILMDDWHKSNQLELF